MIIIRHYIFFYSIVLEDMKIPTSSPDSCHKRRLSWDRKRCPWEVAFRKFFFSSSFSPATFCVLFFFFRFLVADTLQSQTLKNGFVREREREFL